MFAYKKAVFSFGLASLAAGFAWSSLATPLAGVSPAAEPSVVLADTQLASINVEPVGEHAFPQEMQTVGNIDFNQDLLTQVFTQYQGRIIKAFAKVGDIVKKGDASLYHREHRSSSGRIDSYLCGRGAGSQH